jgi:5-methylcytosine-specific restriction enzyme B
MANVWKIAPGDNAYMWQETHEQGCITINWMNQTNLAEFETKEELKKAFKKAGQTDNRGASWEFAKVVQRGDTIVANKGQNVVVGIGLVEGDYLPPDDPRNPRKTADEHRHVRRVNWVIDKPVDLHEDIYGLRVTPTILRLSSEQCRKIKQAYLKEDPGLKGKLDQLFPFDPSAPSPPSETIMEALLRQIGQIILYGPPGTGKTREAKRVALALLTGNESPENANSTDDEIEKQLKPFKDAGRFDLVVFHPAYEYEQFVGGIEPEPTGQQITFKAKAGVFTRLCRYADVAKRSAVLIIDEINRGNLPKLLGELVYALEYRGHEVRLPFDDGRPNLVVPKDLYIIATMNSADRSIGHIDVAIRRRFGLYPLEPNPDVVRQVWSSAGDESYGKQLADLMSRINSKLRNGPDAAEWGVGQSYFLPKPGAAGDIAKKQVEMKWHYQVQPLLREYEQFLNRDTDFLKEFYRSLKEVL